LSATRVQISIRDLPQNIQILTEEFLKDTAAYTLEDIVRYAPGVTAGQNPGSFNIRGFVTLVNLRNGFRQFGGGVQQDSATLDRVEILKGPSAVLYGVTQPGGLINFITKKPLSEKKTTVSLSAGTDSFFRSVLDTTGPLTNDKSVLYRLIAAYDTRETEKWFEEYETFILAPSLTFRPLKNTTIRVEYSYEERDNNPAYLWPRKSSKDPVTGQRVASAELDGHADISEFLPREFNSTGDDTHDKRETHYTSIEWQQRIGDSLNGRTVFYSQKKESDLLSVGGGRFADPANTILNRDNYNITGDIDAWVLQTDWVVNYDLKEMSLKTLVGGQYYEEENTSQRRNRDNGFGGTLRKPIDLTTLTFDQLDIGNFPADYTISASNRRSENTVWGLYLHQRITMLDERLNILGGFRYDDFENASINLDSPTLAETSFSGDEISPQIAASFRVADPVSLYAMWSTAMEPLGGVDGDGNPFKPFQGEGWDIGMKFELMDGKLSGSLAVFDIIRENIPRRDPDRDNFQYQGGEENSQGMEIELFYNPSPSLEVVVGYSYTDAMVTVDTQVPDNEDWPLQNVPKHHFTAWGRYSFTDGALEGLKLGLGVLSVSEAYAANGYSNRFYTNPAYTTFDGMIQYDFEVSDIPVSASLNIKNLLDEDYFLGRFRGWAPKLGYVFTLRAEF